MIKVEVKVLPLNDADRGKANIVVWTKRHGDYVEKSNLEVVPGEKDAVRTILLDAGEYITVDGDAQQELYLDAQQNVVLKRDRPAAPK